MADVKNKKVSIEVEVDTSKAIKQLNSLKKNIDSSLKKVEINIEINISDANKAVKQLSNESDKAAKKLAESFSKSFDNAGKKIRNITENVIKKSLGSLSGEGSEIGSKFAENFVNTAIKVIRASIALFKTVSTGIVKGMATAIKGSAKLVQNAMSHLTKGITQGLQKIGQKAKGIARGLGSTLSNALKQTIDLSINANLNASGGGSGSGVGSNLFNAGMVATSLKAITAVAAKNSMPNEAGNAAAAFASKVIDAGQKLLILGKVAYQSYTLIKSNWPKIIDTFKTLSAKIQPILSEALKLAGEAAKKVLTSALKLAGEAAKKVLISALKLAGKAFIAGIKQLCETLVKTIKTACRLIKETASNMWTKVKDFFGFSSSNSSSYNTDTPDERRTNFRDIKSNLYEQSRLTREEVSHGSASDIAKKFNMVYSHLGLDLNEMARDSNKLGIDVASRKDEIKLALEDSYLIESIDFDSASDKMQLVSKMADDIIFCAQKYIDTLNGTTTATKQFANNTLKSGSNNSGIPGVKGVKKVKIPVDIEEENKESLIDKIKSVDDAIQAYSKFESKVNAVIHPVKTLKSELAKKITVGTIKGIVKDAENATKSFNKLRVAVKEFKNASTGSDKGAAGLKVLSSSAQLAFNKLKVVFKTNAIGKLIERMKGPTEKASKKLADKVPGGKDTIGLFKGALGKLAVLFGGFGLASFFKNAAKEAITLESSIIQLNRRLGESAVQFESFATGEGLDLGLSRQNIAEFGNNFSIFVSKFESDSTRATETTIDLLEAAAKTAQATGYDMQTVMDSFRSALTG